MLPKTEQIPGDTYRKGETVRAVILRVDNENNNPKIILSRTAPIFLYRTQTTYAQPGGFGSWCWSMILLNLLCNCCCGGWGFRGFRM